MNHKLYMGIALEEAQKALEKDEVPVGAIIVHNDEIIGRGHNQRESLQNPIAHAEILAIEEAAKKLCTWRLLNSMMYVTMEPCTMCAGALVLARLKTVVFSIRNNKEGACGSIFNIVQEPKLNHFLDVVEGVRAEEARILLQQFFQEKRSNKKNICKNEGWKME